MAAACRPGTPTPARPTASAAIPSTPTTPTTPQTANAAAGPACGRRNPSGPWKEVARMRPERVESPKPQGSESAVDSLLWLAVGAVLVATVLVWVVGQVATVLFGAHHWLPLSLAEVAGVPFHLAKHPGDPRLAWPKAVRGMLPSRACQRGAGAPMELGSAAAGARRPVGDQVAAAPPDRPGATAGTDHAWPPGWLVGAAAT